MIGSRVKTTDDIMSKFNKALTELQESERQFSQKQEKNEEQIQALETENSEIEAELSRNKNVTNKLRDLLGG